MISPRRNTFVVAALCICPLLAGVKAARADVRVALTNFFVNWKLAPNSNYSGTCPVWFRFFWNLASNDDEGVSYYFETNDGKITPRQYTFIWHSQLAPAYIDWQVGVNKPKFANFSGWLELHVTGHNIVANKMNFTVHCR